MSRIVLVSPTAEFRSRLTDAFGALIEEATTHWWQPELLNDPTIAAAKIAASAPSLVLFEVDGEEVRGFPTDTALTIITALTKTNPEMPSIILAEPRSDLFGRAMRAGVRDILDPNGATAELRDRVNGLLGIADRLRATTTSSYGPQGSVVTMLEPKGGSGKTSIMSNLAVLLAQRFPGEVVAVDLDLQFGDLSNALLLEPRYTMADVAMMPGQMDSTTIKAFLTRREGLFVLCAPNSPAEADMVTPELVGRVVDLLRSEFKWVLIDTSAGLIEPTLTVLDHSTDIILLASLDVFSIRNLRKTIEIMDQIGVVIPQRHLVLNRADSKVGLDRTEAIMELGMRHAIEIPSSRYVPLSLNRGEPVVEMQVRAPVARRIADLAEQLVTTRPAKDEWSQL